MRFAVIGTSEISKHFVEAGLTCPGFNLTGIYSRSAKRAANFSQVFGAIDTYGSILEVAASCVIDAVYIASPNSLHFEQALLMLQNGKHVLCEKPVTTSEYELSCLLEVAAENNVVLLEAARHLFSPGTHLLFDLLPRIGTVRRASFVMGRYSAKYILSIIFINVIIILIILTNIKITYSQIP